MGTTGEVRTKIRCAWIPIIATQYNVLANARRRLAIICCARIVVITIFLASCANPFVTTIAFCTQRAIITIQPIATTYIRTIGQSEVGAEAVPLEGAANTEGIAHTIRTGGASTTGSQIGTAAIFTDGGSNTSLHGITTIDGTGFTVVADRWCPHTPSSRAEITGGTDISVITRAKKVCVNTARLGIAGVE